MLDSVLGSRGKRVMVPSLWYLLVEETNINQIVTEINIATGYVLRRKIASCSES